MNILPKSLQVWKKPPYHHLASTSPLLPGSEDLITQFCWSSAYYQCPFSIISFVVLDCNSFQSGCPARKQDMLSCLLFRKIDLVTAVFFYSFLWVKLQFHFDLCCRDEEKMAALRTTFIMLQFKSKDVIKILYKTQNSLCVFVCVCVGKRENERIYCV